MDSTQCLKILRSNFDGKRSFSKDKWNSLMEALAFAISCVEELEKVKKENPGITLFMEKNENYYRE